MKAPQLSAWFSGRTKLVTIAAIVGISVTGVAAVGANVGILNNAAGTKTGALSAAGDLLSAPASALGMGGTDGAGSSSAVTSRTAVYGVVAVGGGQEFSVDEAGTVTLVAGEGGLRLDSVNPAAGWTWSLAQSSPTEVAATFSNGRRTLEFKARGFADGTIMARVENPLASGLPGTAKTTTSSPRDDDDHGSEGGDHYEGGNDDD